MANRKTTVATAPVETEPIATPAPASDLVTLSRAEIAQMIADALQARDDDEPTGPPPGMELAKAIGDAVAAGLEKNNPKKVNYGTYLKRPTAGHPLGMLGPKLKRNYFQNGRQIVYDQVNDAGIELLNQITHSGRYLDRKVEVLVREVGGGEQAVEIRYSNKEVDQRMDLKGLFRSFNDLIQQIVDAQKLEIAEDEERRVVRRPFGSSRQTLAAERAAQ